VFLFPPNTLEMSCVICEENAADWVVLPCMHLCCCGKCLSKLDETNGCPICLTRFTGVEKIFLSGVPIKKEGENDQDVIDDGDKFFESKGEMVLHMIGRTGPLTIDTEIAQHNILLSAKESEKYAIKDIFIVGTAGKKVERGDITKVLEQIKAYRNNKVFDNGRSYAFEGIEYKNGSYNYCWGS
jgi:hypothetical protein